jgi:predicted transcriptional regulator
MLRRDGLMKKSRASSYGPVYRAARALATTRPIELMTKVRRLEVDVVARVLRENQRAGVREFCEIGL